MDVFLYIQAFDVGVQTSLYCGGGVLEVFARAAVEQRFFAVCRMFDQERD